MKKSLLLLLLACFGIVSAQVKSSDLVPYHKGSMWGFSDVNKKIIIPPVYDNAQPFTQGLAAVRKDSLWGYIDSTGKVMIPFRYDEAQPFRGNFAITYLDGFAGAINRFGDVFISHKYDEVEFKADGKLILATDTNGVKDLYNSSGKMICKADYFPHELFSDRYLQFERIGKFKLTKAEIDAIKKDPEFASDKKLQEIAKKGYELKQMRGLLDIKTGKEVVPPFFKDIEFAPNTKGLTKEVMKEMEKISDAGGDFVSGHEGLFFLITEDDRDRLGLYSFKKGEIIKAEYDDIDFDDLMEYGVSIAETNKKYWLIDSKGKKLSKKPYDRINGDIDDGDKWLQTKMGDKEGIIDISGREIVPAIFDNVSIRGTFAICEFRNMETFISKPSSGKDSTKYVLYESAGKEWEYRDFGISAIERDKKKGVMDSTGKLILAPRYESVSVSLFGISVKDSSGYSFYDKQGKLLVNGKFNNLLCALGNDGAVLVQKDNNLCVLKNGKLEKLMWVLNESYILPMEQFEEAGEVFTWLDIDGMAGVISYKNGKATIKIPFKYVPEQFYNKRMIVSDTFGKFGVVDYTGKFLIPVNFWKVEDAGSSSGIPSPASDFLVAADSAGPFYVYSLDGNLIYTGQGNYYGVDNASDYPKPYMYIAFDKYRMVYSADKKGMLPYKMTNSNNIMEETGFIVDDDMGAQALADIDWNLLTPFKYKSLTEISYGEGSKDQVLKYETFESKFGLVNMKGEELTGPKYSSIDNNDQESGYLVTIGEKYGMLDLNGKEIIPPLYKSIEMPYYDMMLAWADDGTTAVYDTEGNVLLKPGKLAITEIIRRGTIAGKPFLDVVLADDEGTICFIDADGNLFFEK